MSDEDWQVLRQRMVVRRLPWLTLYEQDLLLPDGSVVEDYLTIEAPPYSAVMPVRADGRIVCIEEYKHGPGRVVLRLPAGYMHHGEDPLQAAQRELLEETGYQAEAWQLLGIFHDDGNRGMSLGHHFLATGAQEVTQPQANDLSPVRPVILHPSEVRSAIYDGRVAEAAVVAGILLGLDALQAP